MGIKTAYWSRTLGKHVDPDTGDRIELFEDFRGNAQDWYAGLVDVTSKLVTDLRRETRADDPLFQIENATVLCSSSTELIYQRSRAFLPSNLGGGKIHTQSTLVQVQSDKIIPDGEARIRVQLFHSGTGARQVKHAIVRII